MSLHLSKIPGKPRRASFSLRSFQARQVRRLAVASMRYPHSLKSVLVYLDKAFLALTL